MGRALMDWLHLPCALTRKTSFPFWISVKEDLQGAVSCPEETHCLAGRRTLHFQCVSYSTQPVSSTQYGLNPFLFHWIQKKICSPSPQRASMPLQYLITELACQYGGEWYLENVKKKI